MKTFNFQLQTTILNISSVNCVISFFFSKIIILRGLYFAITKPDFLFRISAQIFSHVPDCSDARLLLLHDFELFVRPVRRSARTNETNCPSWITRISEAARITGVSNAGRCCVQITSWRVIGVRICCSYVNLRLDRYGFRSR